MRILASIFPVIQYNKIIDLNLVFVLYHNKQTSFIQLIGIFSLPKDISLKENEFQEH